MSVHLTQRQTQAAGFSQILATSSVDKWLSRLRKCTVLQEENQCQEIPLRGKIKGSKNVQDGGIAIDRNSDWILLLEQIAFILDGSGSIEPEDFERAKAFIHKMMKTLYEKFFETGSFTLKGHLNVQVTSPLARFGFTVPGIGNISGDGYEDIAVGPPPLKISFQIVPLLDSIYIFNGDKDKIKSSFSQDSSVQTIDGGFDFPYDGLKDTTVGSLENVIVLW
ncbi:unnamed protein product [Bubo scandiacus]